MKKILSAVLLICCSLSGYAQSTTAATYALATLTGTYTSVSGGTAVTPTDLDDGAVRNIAIGFTFRYCGTNYTTLAASANGYVSLANCGASSTTSCTGGAGAIATYTNSTATLSQIGGGVGVLMGLWDDINLSAASTTSTSCAGVTVRYATTGTAPNRVFTIEYFNVGQYHAAGVTTITGCGQFEIKLYETTNAIEFCYGTSNFGGMTASIGISNSATDFKMISNNIQFPPYSTSTFTTTIAPPVSGTIYRFCPQNIGVTATNASPFCAQTNAPLLGAATGTAATYTWAGPLAYTATALNATVTNALTTASGVYTLTGTIGTCFANDTTTLTINPRPAHITGADSVCVGSTTALASTTPSGTWSSGTTTIATISGTGVVTGVAAGNSVIRYTLSTGCDTTLTMRVNALPVVAAISGPSSLCVNDVTTYTNATTGGVWASSNPAVATVSTTGVVTALTPGSTTITYRVTNISNCATTVSLAVTVNPNPNPITGTDSVCVGQTTALANTSIGGTWSSTSVAIATVSGLGVVSGVAAGNTNIIYTLATGCDTTLPIRVLALPIINPTTGLSTVCVGANTTLSNTTSGGTWSSANAAIAAVNTTGVVTGVSAGSTVITYTVTNASGCTDFVTFNITVVSFPTITLITGSPTVCEAATTTLSNATPGGSWSSANPTIATVAAATGVVTGVSGGVATITYAVTNACGTADTTFDITVIALPTAGTITGPSNLCQGATALYSNATPGGSWSSSNTTVATIGVGGFVTTVNPGTTIISYTVMNVCDTVFATLNLTVDSIPNPLGISGSVTLCEGASTLYTDASPGGTWSSGDATIATVDASGIVTGVAGGNTRIYYTITNACGTGVDSANIIINPLPDVAPINGVPTLCLTDTATFRDTTAGGVWSTSNASVASISTTGFVTAVGLGSATISYTVTNACGSTSSLFNVTSSSTPSAGTIAGPTNVCVGDSITLTNAVPGGTWTSSNPAVASFSIPGHLVGVSPGTVTITYTVTLPCGTASTTTSITVNPIPTAGTISGPTSVCVGASITLTPSTTGGTWSSINAAIATADPTTGVVSGVSAGSVVIAYSISTSCGTATAYWGLTVNPLADPGTISGPNNVCVGSTASYTPTVSGGTWSSSNTSVATISTTGSASTLTAGTTIISYAVTNICGTIADTIALTVSTLPTAGTITGTSSICVGTNTTLSATATGGTWSSADGSIATVNASGVVTAVSGGTTTISYTQTNICGSVSATYTFTVLPLPAPSAITGRDSVCQGFTYLYINSLSGGTWSSSNASVATIASSGVATAVAAGSATLSYSVTNTCGTTVVTKNILVERFPSAGVIVGPTNICLGASATYTDTVVGGTWSSANPSIAAITSSGVVTGVTTGTTNIYYTVVNSCGSTNVTVSINVVPYPTAGTISGPTTLCPGGVASMSASVGGGSWTTSNPSVATINVSGTVNAIAAGNTMISYTVTNACSSAVATAGITVNPAPYAGGITGPNRTCVGASVALADTILGGTWTSSNASIASISAAGIVTGVSAGSAVITYTVTNSCGTAFATFAFNVDTALATAGTISGTTPICSTATTVWGSTVAGGTWSSSNTSIATVNAGGLITAVTNGTVLISYSVSNACGVQTAIRTLVVEATPDAGSITAGTTTVCANDSILLVNSITGGTWSSSNMSVATVAATGYVLGISSGTSTISYSVTNSCGTADAILDINVNPSPVLGAIAGPTTFCTGNSYTLTNTTSGGTWTSSNASVATIDATSGDLAALTTGFTTISYSATNIYGCTTMVTVNDTVNLSPDAGTLSGTGTTVCSGSTLSITSTATGGTWSSSDVSVATVDASGVVTGVSFGSAVISYSVTNSCGTDVASVSINVNPTPTVSAITGATSLCNNSTTTLSNATTGGTWSSSDASIATIDASSGDLTGVSAGTVTITYNVTNIFGCSVMATHVDTIYPSTDAGSITASTTTVCAGNVITLVDTASGGTWSSSDASIATVDATGVVTGVGAGSVTISYATSNIYGCNDLATADITVNPTTTLSPIAGATSQCTGTNITLTNTTLFGTWSSSDASIASIDPTTGVVTGNADGIATITYSYTNAYGCSSAVTSVDTVHLTADAGTISASTTTICVGSDLALIDTTTGGVWSSSDASVATVSSTGMVTGLSAGTATISYFMDNAFGCTDLESVSITVNPTPDAGTLSGPSGLCVGATSTWSSTTSGGTWSSSNTSVGTIDATSGTFDGLSAGETQLSYIVSNVFGCADTATAMDTVLSVPTIGAITGTTTICSGTTSTLSSTTTGGVWSSSDASVATVDASTGIVTAVSTGAATITYTVGTTCSAFATTVVTINATPSVSAITGTTSACVGNSSTLSNATTGGAWSSSDAAIATVDASTGIVSGVAAGTATISYSVSSAGCTSHATASYTVHGLPVVGAISGDTAICLGATTTMSDTSVGGTWASSNTAVATINSTTGAVTGLSVDTVTLSYTITNGFGCSNTAYFAMRVEGLPVVSAIAGSGSLCLGSSHTLTSTTTGGTWSSSDTSILAVSSTGVATGRAAGVATVSYTVTSSLGCVGSATTTDTVLALPTVAAITGTPSTCLGDTSRLANSTTGGTWSSSAATTATISSTGLVTGLAAGTATITYTYTNTAGCTNIATTSFTVNALPTVSAITGSTRVCLGSNITLVDTTTGGVWSTASSTIATVSSTGVVSSVAVGATLISYTVTNSAGCSASAVVTVTVSSAPTVSAIGGPTAACLGSLITMTNATTGGVWSSSNTAVATIGTTSGSVTTLSVGTTTISYTVTSSSGCVATATSTLTIDTMAMGTLSPAADTIEICHSNNVNMNVLISGTGLSYQWFRDGVAIAGATSISYATNVPAYYTVNVSNGACSQMISGITLINSPLPVIVTSGGGVLRAGRFASYQWYLDGVAISGATDSSYTATTPGSYTVITTTGSGCVDQSAPYVVLPGTGVGVVTDKNSIQIYPNPASSTLSISAQEVVNVVIMSADGKVVISATAATSIDVSNLADGMYMVSIYNQQHQLIKVDKFIKAQ